MNRRLTGTLTTLTSLALLSASAASYARGLEVYGYAAPKQGDIEAVYTFDYVQKAGDTNKTMSYFGKGQPDENGVPVVSREKLAQHTVEFEYGLTDNWSTAIYLDFEQPKGEDFKYVQTRAVMTRYNFFKKGERYFDAGIYFEYYAPREQYQGATNDELEVRLILEKDIGAWAIKLNPTLAKIMSGPGVDEAMEFEFSGGVYRNFADNFKAGVEVFDKFGEIANTKSSKAREGYISPMVDYDIKDGLAVQFGVAFGLSDASDDRIVRARLEMEL